MDMKTAAQHNSEVIGMIEVPTQPTRRESREALDKRAADLTAEVAALRSLVRDLRNAADGQPSMERAVHGMRESIINTGAILMPGGTRIVLRHIQKYSPGGDNGVHFKLSDGGHIWNPPAASSIPGAEAKRQNQQAQAIAALDKLFNVETE